MQTRYEEKVEESGEARPVPAATLVLMSGLPGTGRSELAAYLARERGWALFTKDAVTRSLAEVEIAHKLAAYTVMFSLAGLNLRNGLSVVLDASFSLPRTRTQARKVAQEHGASFAAIACVCSDSGSLAAAVGDESTTDRGMGLPGVRLAGTDPETLLPVARAASAPRYARIARRKLPTADRLSRWSARNGSRGGRSR